MEQLVQWWEQLPGQEKTVFTDVGFIIGALILAWVIQQKVRRALADWGIDRVFLIPGRESKGVEKNRWLSALISGLAAISVFLILLDYFLGNFRIFSQPQYRDLFIRGWISLGCYIGALALFRFFVLALLKFAEHSQIKKFIQQCFAGSGEPVPSRYDGQDFATALADFIGVAAYSVCASVLGVLMVADILDLKVLGTIVSEFLAGAGRLFAAVAMVGIGIGAFRYTTSFQGRSEKPNSYFPIGVFAGCILLGIAVLASGTSSILSLSFFLFVLAVAGLILYEPARAAIPDLLAGLYLRASGYLQADLKAGFEGYRLTGIGWITSTLGNDDGERKEVRNREIPEAGIKRNERTV